MLSVGSLFTGIGMLDYGLHLAGLTDQRWVCERDEWRRERILAQRFPGAVRYDDVRAVGHGCEPVELIVGGFPCKGASTAGKRTGFEHPETVLWREMRRAISELRPRYVLVENVANLLALHDGAVWGEVLGDLATLGFDVVWDCLPAAAVGAPHLRDRVFAVATHTDARARDGVVGGVEDGVPRRADVAGSGRSAAADPECDALRQQPEPEPGSRGAPVAGRAAAAVADAAGQGGPAGWRRERPGSGQPGAGRRDHAQPGGEAAANADARRGQGRPVTDGPGQQERHVRSRHDAHGSGVPVGVEWGDYEPAIRRWEAIAGAAPEPLLRGVDARPARRVVRSRLSGLGDGVQVGCGYLAGRYIVDREERRVRRLHPEGGVDHDGR